MIATTNSPERGTQAITYQKLLCSPTFASGLQQIPIYFCAANILISLAVFIGNFLILVALNEEGSLHPPSKHLYRCLAAADLLVGLVTQPFFAVYHMSLVYGHWSLCRCSIDVVYITSYTLCGVSLLTLTAISVDRLLALLLGMRYRQIVTLKRTYIITAILWIISGVAAAFYPLNLQITRLYGIIIAVFCPVISTYSYIKIFCALSHRQTHIQDHGGQQPSQPNALNMERYRKAVHSALWVQLALVVCYVPKFIITIVIIQRKTYSSHIIIVDGITSLAVYLNSALNPFIYCWKIREVRQAVKGTIRRALCCTWT